MRVQNYILPVCLVLVFVGILQIFTIKPETYKPETNIEPKVLGASTENANIETTPNPVSTPKPQVVSNYSKEPTSPAMTYEDADLDVYFEKYSAEYGIDKAWLKGIAQCESNFNANATNGPYAGMFQFTESSWRSSRTQMGLDPDPSLRFNPEEAIRTTSFLLSQGRAGMWPVCSS